MVIASKSVPVIVTVVPVDAVVGVKEVIEGVTAKPLEEYKPLPCVAAITCLSEARYCNISVLTFVNPLFN